MLPFIFFERILIQITSSYWGRIQGFGKVTDLPSSESVRKRAKALWFSGFISESISEFIKKASKQYNINVASIKITIFLSIMKLLSVSSSNMVKYTGWDAKVWIQAPPFAKDDVRQVSITCVCFLIYKNRRIIPTPWSRGREYKNPAKQCSV